MGHALRYISLACAGLAVAIALSFVGGSTTHAAGFDAGRIIDDGVFTDKNTMNPAYIQAFLNSKVPSCDTWGTQTSEYGGGTRRQWAEARGYMAPYTCLRDYTENGRSAAQIIYDTAQAYSINPQVLIVLLQKEQGLVTDTWPVSVQYRSATGYGCPDTAPCDAQYYGLTNQLNWSAKMFRAIMDASPNWYTPYIVGNNYIQYNPTASCGGSTVNIQNRATQALYNYTPYQPNAAALAAAMGTTVSCGAYGNLNFYRYFTSWFGDASGAPYSWRVNSTVLYYDSNRTQIVSNTNGVYNIKPGQKVYARVSVTNTGWLSWPKATTRLGTQRPQDRSSVFADSSWQQQNRVGGYVESGDIVPSGTATFEYSLTAPQTPDIYEEWFGVVVERVGWVSNPTFLHNISVAAPLSSSLRSTNDRLASGATLTPGQNIISSDGNSVLHLSFGGSLEIWTNYVKRWSTNTDGSGADRLVNQTDGNIVLYKGNTPVWASNTFTPGTSGQIVLQSDGNLVLYKNSSAVWASNSVTFDQTDIANSLVLGNQTLFPGQSLYTPDRYYRLTAQSDGNIVLYTPSRAIWSSNTYGKRFDRMIIQDDGNIVTYDGNNYATWSTRTNSTGGTIFRIQGDGNLVLYAGGRALWASNTFLMR